MIVANPPPPTQPPYWLHLAELRDNLGEGNKRGRGGRGLKEKKKGEGERGEKGGCIKKEKRGGRMGGGGCIKKKKRGREEGGWAL